MGSVKGSTPPRMSRIDSSRYEAAPQRTPWQIKRKIASKEAHGFVIEARKKKYTARTKLAEFEAMT